jgi:uncharacterized repeat protein (TIGR03803 family)
VLHSFNGNAAIGDYESPQTGVIFDESGALYGTTVEGGVNGVGTVFKLTPPAMPGGTWPQSVLYTFGFKDDDGLYPYGGLIFDKSGALYGTTEFGGANRFGSVYKLTPPATASGAWIERVLHSFTGSDGIGPLAGVIFDKFGALYGTTGAGGANGFGAVYKLTPPATAGGAWTESVLHRFTGSDGVDPEGRLIFDNLGALYGTTLEGGNGSCSSEFLGCGTAFKLMTFAGTPEAANCYGHSVSALASEFHWLNGAAAALGFASVSALQNAIVAFCGG